MGVGSGADVDSGEVVHLAVSAIDPDGDRLTYSLARPEEGFSFDRATGLVTFDSVGLDAGTYSATVVVSDGEASVSRTISVEVEGGSAIPVFVLMVVGILLLGVMAASYMFKG